MKALGQTEIEEGLTLSSPDATIKSVTYNWENDTVSIEILFNEDGGIFKHSRNFTFNNSGGNNLNSSDVYTFIAQHDKLKNFK